MSAIIWVLRNLDIVGMVVGLLFGLGTIPVMSMLGIAPAMVAEPLANRLVKSIMQGWGGGVLHQNLTDEYDLRKPTADHWPEKFWSRLNGEPFGISLTRSAEAFDGRAERVDPNAIIADGGNALPGRREIKGPVRGGRKTFIETTGEAGLYVRAGEKMAELKDTDGLDVVTVAEDETLKTEAGASGMETKWKVYLWLGMAFLGTIGGGGVFFVL